jgi:hypothetical protein
VGGIIPEQRATSAGIGTGIGGKRTPANMRAVGDVGSDRRLTRRERSNVALGRNLDSFAENRAERQAGALDRRLTNSAYSNHVRGHPLYPLTASDICSPMLLPALPRAGSFFAIRSGQANVKSQSKSGVQCCLLRSRVVSLKASLAGAEAPIPRPPGLTSAPWVSISLRGALMGRT